MTTWRNDGFAGELFKLGGSFMPPPPPGVEPPPLWGVADHIEAVFSAAGVHPSIEEGTVAFKLSSAADAVQSYAQDFGPFVIARGALESQGRWDEFLKAFAELVRRFDGATDASTSIQSRYLIITVDR
jgi:alkanesulfonate monooxygenase SsuD/methylene tetrahydromethanopterin reductase-like flavin-dependent oxidoreductase (luciferase family)